MDAKHIPNESPKLLLLPARPSHIKTNPKEKVSRPNCKEIDEKSARFGGEENGVVQKEGEGESEEETEGSGYLVNWQ